MVHPLHENRVETPYCNLNYFNGEAKCRRTLCAEAGLLTMFLSLTAALGATPSIDEPLRTGNRAPNDAAVVVGIENYFVLPDVPYAARDAEAFRKLLIFTIGVPAANVELLAGTPNKEQVQGAVQDAAKAVGDGGRLWIYFAGHGAAAPSSGERLLLGADAQTDLRSFEARAVSVKALEEIAKRDGAETVMVLDTCYTGRDRSGTELLSGNRFALPSYAMKQPGVLEWTAASPGEWSGPFDAAKHGAFTYLVVGALRGWADGYVSGSRDGKVTIDEAQLYVEESLKVLGIREQRPLASMPKGSEWVLSTNVDEQAPKLELPAVSTRVPVEAAPVVTPGPLQASPEVDGAGFLTVELAGGAKISRISLMDASGGSRATHASAERLSLAPGRYSVTVFLRDAGGVEDPWTFSVTIASAGSVVIKATAGSVACGTEPPACR